MLFYKYIQTYLFFLLSFQCLTHTEKALCFFCPLLNAPRCRARDTHTTLTIAKVYMYHFAVLIIATLSGLRQITDLRHIGKKAHHLASITRVIIFAVRISFLLRSQWDVDRQPYSWKRQPRFDCALFSVPVPCYVSGGFLCLVFIVFIITFCS